jgi:hypothetical protein
MKQLRPLDTRGPFTFRPHHWKMLFGGFIVIGLLFGFLLVHLIYDVSTDPYSYPFGNTRENSWIYTSPAVYRSVAIFCLLSEISGTSLIIAGQLKAKRKLSLVGVGLIVLGIAATLATRMIE